MTEYLDFFGPSGLRTRGTVLVVPGRGESSASYRRFGARLAADSYRVRVLPALPLSTPDGLPLLAATLIDAVTSLSAAVPSDAAAPPIATASAAASPARGLPLAAGTISLATTPVPPLVLVGADTGAAALAALLAQPQPDAPWWPAAAVLAGLPGYGEHEDLGWEAELDSRTHCTVHRGVLTDDPAIKPGALAEAVSSDLLDAAYQSTSELPHLLLLGAEDPFADSQAVASLAKSLPGSRPVVIPGGRHDVLNDAQHRTVAAHIVIFLEALRE